MVIHVNLGGRVNEFDQRTLNVKQVFGPYAVLLDKNMRPVPLKPNGEPLQELKDNETFTIQLSGLGPQGNSVIEKAKKKQLIQTEKDMQAGRAVSISPPPPNLVVTDKARKRMERRSKKANSAAQDQDCNCDCGCFDFLFAKPKNATKKKKKDKYNWTPLIETQEDSTKPTHDRSMKEIEKLLNAALN